ncbi:MAG: phosphonate C-P lyase system protein PhnH [Desulfobacterales bacterium]|jgi:alpha-D-ribose 1-methylphosphonate 5-triphosphate synthase subunit PhnH
MTSEMDGQMQAKAFDDPDLSSEQTFRAILKAMVQPGQLVKIKSKLYRPGLLDTASAAVCLTLLNAETPLWTDLSWDSTAVSWFQFHCGCSVVTETCMAHFALITQPTNMPLLDDFKIGDAEHPESAATLIIQVEGFNGSDGKTLSVPGIKSITHFAPAGIPRSFWEQWQLQAALFPLGVDIFFSCGDLLAALPRTTQLSDSTAG